MPSDGSSSTSSRGLLISARPSASICCSPPDSIPAFWPIRSPSTGNSDTTRASSSARTARSRCRYAPRMRFARTVWCANKRRPSGTSASPSRAMACAGRRETSRPSKTTEPPIGRCSPAMAARTLDFPAPFEPTSDTSSPADNDSDTPFTAGASWYDTRRSVTVSIRPPGTRRARPGP
jgi:hypothetical protein